MGDPLTANVGRRFGFNRNIAALMAVILVVGAGQELWIRFLPAYLEELSGGRTRSCPSFIWWYEGRARGSAVV
jgi:hypothetical protein